MASLEKRGATYRVKFRHGGRQLGGSLKTGDRREAEALLKRLEANLHELEIGRLPIPPPTVDLLVFLLSDGRSSEKVAFEPPLPFQTFLKRYRDRPVDGKEAASRYTEAIHMKHLERLIGPKTTVNAITAEALQAFIDKRSQEVGRRGAVSATTVKKEIGTFASIWNNWGVAHALVSGPAPTKGLRYHKTKAKPPFQTWDQIERGIARGGLSVPEQDCLWDSLYLTLLEVEQVLLHVERNCRFAFVYPMFVFAAHTGARRSEILRSQVDDFDFDAKIVRIREKKKDRSKELTYRHVPLSTKLADVMRFWLTRHPGGYLTMCVRPNEPITPQMAAHHFGWALENSKWTKIKGWHCFRHSFASNCAASGVDQRVISAWMGHMTEEMERRYRHLFPDQARLAMAQVFG